MVEAEALVDLDASAFIGSLEVEEADGADGLGASAFIASLGGEEAAGGVALGLELGGEDDCAKADDSINPLSAVVINNF